MGDAELARLALTAITILKIDAEGHDLAVLKGFSQALAAGRIDLVQFEYNHATLLAGQSLRSFFSLLSTNFLICRLLPNGLEACGYHPALDNFAQSNWVGVRLDLIDQSMINDLSIRPARGLLGGALESTLSTAAGLLARLRKAG